MHEARHTAITQLLRDTGNLKLIQMLAGHADIGTNATSTHTSTPATSKRRSVRNRR
ncbi:MAG: site-specific integrase [Actinobacteria bacterium]|nr:site-specific integrase [Actinomycetota bacterium]